MDIIISGVAGFIGSNLASALLNGGHKVTGIDNLSHGYVRNIKPLETNKKFQFIKEDIRNERALLTLKGDCFVHLASQKIPRYTSAFITLEENTEMLKNVVKKCTDDKIKLVFASTSDIYGKSPQIPYNENSDIILGPTTIKRWAYAVSKLYAEQYIIANKDEFGLRYTIMRLFGSYGPNQNVTWWGGPQSVFIESALKKEPLEIHGNGQQTRTFTYIEDTIQGIIKCIFEKKAENEIFNIAGNPSEEISITELGAMIWKMIHKEVAKPLLKFVPYNTFGNYEDVPRRVPNIEKIKQLLGYCPKFSLAEGLEKTVEWQKTLH